MVSMGSMLPYSVPSTVTNVRRLGLLRVHTYAHVCIHRESPPLSGSLYHCLSNPSIESSLFDSTGQVLGKFVSRRLPPDHVRLPLGLGPEKQQVAVYAATLRAVAPGY